LGRLPKRILQQWRSVRFEHQERESKRLVSDELHRARPTIDGTIVRVNSLKFEGNCRCEHGEQFPPISLIGCPEKFRSLTMEYKDPELLTRRRGYGMKNRASNSSLLVDIELLVIRFRISGVLNYDRFDRAHRHKLCSLCPIIDAGVALFTRHEGLGSRHIAIFPSCYRKVVV
jgi:hypothetical protein